MEALLATINSIVLFTGLTDAVPVDACFATFRWDDCGRPPQPVMYYWKPGSRCEVGIWKGCLPNMNMFKDEYECVSTCIFTVRAQPPDFHRLHEEEYEDTTPQSDYFEETTSGTDTTGNSTDVDGATGGDEGGTGAAGGDANDGGGGGGGGGAAPDGEANPDAEGGPPAEGEENAEPEAEGDPPEGEAEPEEES